jgi:hypothetical protein
MEEGIHRMLIGELSSRSKTVYMVRLCEKMQMTTFYKTAFSQGPRRGENRIGDCFDCCKSQ